MRKEWANHVFHTLTEQGGIRFLDALTTIVLIRLFSSEHFGLFSVYQSWVSVAALLLPSIDLVLYRRYAEFKRNGTLNEELSVFRFFNYLKLLILIFLVIGLSFIPEPVRLVDRVFLLSFAFLLPFSQSFYGFMREPLRFEMKQHLVAWISLFQRVVLLLALVGVAAFLSSSVAIHELSQVFTHANRSSHFIAYIVSAAITIYVITGFVWSFVSREYFRKSPFIPKSLWPKMSENLFGIVLWIHVSGVITQSIQTLDLMALNHFKTPLEEIARYSIALKAANFFQIIPIALTNSFGVYLARLQGQKNKADELKLVYRFLAIFTLLSLALFLVGLAVGQPLLSFLAKNKLNSATLGESFEFFKWQLAGILVCSACYPLTTYLGARADLKRVLISVGVPWLLISTAGYFMAASHGALAAAQMNLLVYVVYAILHFIYFLRKH